MVWWKRPAPPAPAPAAWWEEPTTVTGLNWGEALVLAIVAAIIIYVRMHGREASRRALAAKGERTLDIAALARAATFKDVFLAYLNAAVLEPLLSIASEERSAPTKHLLIDILQLLGLVFWTYMLTDAFDTADTAATFVYRHNIPKDAPLKFLTRKKRNIAVERGGLAGSLSRDAALMFCLLGIFAAFAGVVEHREVVHSWAVLLLWAIMHHQARAATSWGSGYFSTFLMPSAALLPLEYCLPLMGDLDIVGDSEGLESWRSFVREQTGIELSIVA